MTALDSLIRRLRKVPPDYRWAGEEDYFDQTKYLKLVYSGNRQFNDGNFPSKSGDSVRGNQDQVRQYTPSPTRGTLEIRSSRSCSDRSPGIFDSYSKKSGETNELKKLKLEKRIKIHKKYSNIHLKQKQSHTNDFRSSYDRLFSRLPSNDYPYENPIPKCLLTRENIDNLRDIIVDSGRKIEWKMLTPIRPESEYEEKFFDKLIELHRCRYKTRLELGYFDHDHLRTPFRYTRHQPFIVQYEAGVHKGVPVASISRQHTSLTALTRMKQRYSVKNSLSPGQKSAGLTIPSLTLTTSDALDEGDKFARPRIAEDSDSKPTSSSHGHSDGFSYDKYSRFYKTKNTFLHDNDQSKSGDDPKGGRKQSSTDDKVENELDKIINQLMLD